MAKKQLSRQEEFEILKMVMDKFLWLGVGIMAFGFWKIVNITDFWLGFSLLLAGAVLLLIFLAILLKEYKIQK